MTTGTRTSSCKVSVLQFLRDIDMPFTNNEAERDLLRMKLHQKILRAFAPSQLLRPLPFCVVASSRRGSKAGAPEDLDAPRVSSSYMPSDRMTRTSSIASPMHILGQLRKYLKIPTCKCIERFPGQPAWFLKKDREERYDD